MKQVDAMLTVCHFLKKCQHQDVCRFSFVLYDIIRQLDIEKAYLSTRLLHILLWSVFTSNL